MELNASGFYFSPNPEGWELAKLWASEQPATTNVHTNLWEEAQAYTRDSYEILMKINKAAEKFVNNKQD